MNKGFIKLNRDITERDWYKEPLTLMLYIHLTITANWHDDTYKGFEIKRGERVASYATLAAETGLSVRNIRTALAHLISTGDVTKRLTSDVAKEQTSNVTKIKCGNYTVISVSNYNNSPLTDNIPDNDSGNETDCEMTSKATTTKEYKEYKELKEREEEEEKADSKTFNKDSSSSVSDVVNLYCELCKSLPSPNILPETEANIRRAISFHGMEKIRTAFQTVESTPFLRGDVKNWCADINWIFAGTNLDKILSGKYREYYEYRKQPAESYSVDVSEYKQFINNF